MDTKQIQIGSYVSSINGRDCNKISIVYDILDEKYVLLIDGKGKKISAPKKKSKKHIINLGVVNEKIAEKIRSGSKIFEAEVYSAISKFELPTKKIEGGSLNV